MFMRLLTVACLVLGAACAAHREESARVAPPAAAANGDGIYARTTVSIECGSILDPPLFAGRVVYEREDGTVAPVTDVRFFRGIGNESLSDGSLAPATIEVDRDGRFAAKIAVATSSTTWKEGGEVLATSGWVEDVVFKLMAPGCRSLVVHFGVEWKEQDLVMKCPDRSSERGERGRGYMLHDDVTLARTGWHRPLRTRRGLAGPDGGRYDGE